MFSIFVDEAITWPWFRPEMGIAGVIQYADDVIEPFSSPIHYWSKEGYERSWLKALEHMVNGASMDALVTAVFGPGIERYVGWRPMHRVGEHLAFSEQYLQPEFAPGFDVRRYGEWLEPYQAGHGHSEWRVPLAEIIDFLERDVLGGSPAIRAAEWSRIQQVLADREVRFGAKDHLG